MSLSFRTVFLTFDQDYFLTKKIFDTIFKPIYFFTIIYKMHSFIKNRIIACS